jgi:hypothetical protein
MKTRFVSNVKFLEIVKRLFPRGTNRQIESLFNKLYQRIDFGGSERNVVDLKDLFFLLEIADGDSRRAFEDKTSVISTGIEFWNQQESSGSLPFSPIRPPTKQRIISSKGLLYEENYSSHLSVACLLRGTRTPM